MDVLCVCVTGLKLFYSGGTFTFEFHFKIKMWFDLRKNDSWFEDVIWDLALWFARHWDTDKYGLFYTGRSIYTHTICLFGKECKVYRLSLYYIIIL